MTARTSLRTTGAAGTERDLGRLLGLSGPGAWAVAALFIATYLIITAISGGPPMGTLGGVLSLVLIIASAVVLVAPWPTPLPLPVTLPLIASVGLTTALMAWQLPTEGWPGWMSWHFSADNFLMFMVAMRGRVAWGTIGALLMVGVAMLWSGLEAGDPLHGLMLTYWQLASYFAGAFFALWMKRTSRRILEFQETERRRIAVEQALEAGADERRRQLEYVRAVAGPALEAIAAGTVTDADRREHALIEAELRDRIRGRSLAVPPLTTAVRAARGRGAHVALLDDLRHDDGRTAPPEDVVRAAAKWAAMRVADAQADEITVRLARVGGTPVVTVAAGSATESFSLAEVPEGPRAEPDPRA